MENSHTIEQKISDQIYQLVQVTTQLSTQMTEMQKSLAKIEAVTPSILLHDEQISQLKVSLDRGNNKFEKIESSITTNMDEINKKFEKFDTRVDTLEREEGNKAKRIFATVGSYLLVTVAAAILSNIGNIIQALGGK